MSEPKTIERRIAFRKANRCKIKSTLGHAAVSLTESNTAFDGLWFRHKI